MKANVRMFVIVAASVALLWATSLVRSADSTGGMSKSNATNVNWLGPIVVGKESSDTVGGPFPHASREVEIGLRGDGVVVWRRKAGQPISLVR